MYCEYLRKSRVDIEAEARGEGETLNRHANILTALANKRGLEIGAVYKEVVSGETIAARPVMQRLLSEVEQGLWEGVLVVEVERLARGDTIDQGIVAQTFKYSNTKIITPVKDYDPNNEFDEEYFEFGLFMSRREYKTINRRLQQGRLSAVKEGRYIGNTSPYGYEKFKTDKGEHTLKINEAEVELVRMVFNLYTHGELKPDGTIERIGVSKIVNRLNNSEFKPRNGRDWSVATIRNMLTNPVYIGKVRWNNRKTVKKMVNGEVKVGRPRAKEGQAIVVDGLHPAIIDDETFELAQYYMKQNPAKPVGQNRQMTNPLSGLVVCDMCGHKMVRRPYPDREPALICTNTNCRNVSSDLSSVEAKILKSLEGWLGEYRLKWKAENDVKAVPMANNEKALSKLKAEHTKLKKQLDNAYDLVEQGIYTPEVFIERSTAIKAKIQANEAEQSNLIADIKEAETRTQAKKDIIPKVEKLLEVYNELPTAEDKNVLLREVIEKVVYRKEKGGRWGDPEDYELVIFPKIPNSID